MVYRKLKRRYRDIVFLYILVMFVFYFFLRFLVLVIVVYFFLSFENYIVVIFYFVFVRMVEVIYVSR